MPRDGERCHNEIVKVPGAHIKLDDCYQVKSICCDLVQKNACADKPAPHREHHRKKLQIVPEPIVLEPHCLNVDVCLKPKFTPGKVDVYAGDVHIDQQIEVEVFEASVIGCAPIINFKCADQKKRVCAPHVVHHPGHVYYNPTFTYTCGKKCDKPRHGGVDPCGGGKCDKKPRHNGGKKPRH